MRVIWVSWLHVCCLVLLLGRVEVESLLNSHALSRHHTASTTPSSSSSHATKASSILNPSLSFWKSWHAKPSKKIDVRFSYELHHNAGHGHVHHLEGTTSNNNQTSPYNKLSLRSVWRDPNLLFKLPKGKAVVIATLFILISSIVRRKLTKLDLMLYVAFSSTLMLFDNTKSAVKKWITRWNLFREGIVQHSKPVKKSYFWKQESVADRVTLLGVGINIILSVAKFLGGIAFNSAVLVADAGHSLSDLFSDFITLWAVQVARLPADKDHPYGHGKFESVGSLFLALTLIATGVSVGTWSYDKMLQVLMNQAAAKQSLKIPSWPALGLALLSIAAKEWLYRITKRVGENLNSQILIANAWHHRSDAFSSILSLFSIAAAIYLPGLLVADSAAGIFIAGMICITGIEVLVESVKQLTDSSDEEVAKEVAGVVLSKVEGVRGIKNIRARSVGSGSLVDMTIFTDMKLSTSAAHALAERTRWKVIEDLPNVIDVLVRTQGVDTVLCPLLSKDQPSIEAVEAEVRQLIHSFDSNGNGNSVQEIKKVTVHYVGANTINVEIVLSFQPTLSLEEIRSKANMIKYAILQQCKNIVHADIQLDLSEVASESQLGYVQ